MSTKFILPAYSINKQATRPFHRASGLPVQPSVQGWFAHDGTDFYRDPSYSPSSYLTDEILFLSCLLEVTESAYLEDSVPSGNYDCDTEGVTIVLRKKDWRAPRQEEKDTVWYRPVLVTAKSVEDMRSAITLIRRGEIAPVGRSETVLERALADLAEAESNAQELRGDLQIMRADVVSREEQVAECMRIVNCLTVYLSGESDDLGYRNLQAERDFEGLRIAAVGARRKAHELALIKQRRWHRFWDWVAQLK